MKHSTFVKIFHMHNRIYCEGCRNPEIYEPTAVEIGAQVLVYILLSWILIPIGSFIGLSWCVGRLLKGLDAPARCKG